MSDTPEVQLQLKKRARRRLVGAVAVAGLAAVVLPMVMDEEPKQQIPDVQIRIPGQNQTALGLAPARSGGESALAEAASGKAVDSAAVKAAEKTADKPANDKAGEKASEAANGTGEHKSEARTEHKSEKSAEKPSEKPAEKQHDKPGDKTGDKPPARPPEKPAEKSPEKAAEKPAKAGENGQSGQYLILIGAFANPANVKQLQTKIGELGIKVITEPLDSPDGKRTRVRAGPFASREAAEKALEKIRRIGVNGVVAAKQ